MGKKRKEKRRPGLTSCSESPSIISDTSCSLRAADMERPLPLCPTLLGNGSETLKNVCPVLYLAPRLDHFPGLLAFERWRSQNREQSLPWRREGRPRTRGLQLKKTKPNPCPSLRLPGDLVCGKPGCKSGVR